MTSTTTKRIGLNMVSCWAASLAQIVLGVLLTPLMILELGVEGYGICAVAMSINTLAMIADMRIRVSLSREMTAALAANDAERASRLCSSGAVVYCVLGGLAGGLCFALAPQLATWFKVSPAMYHDAMQLIRYYGGFSIFFSFVQPIYSSTLTARNRFDLINYVNLFVGVGRGVTVIAALVLSGHDLAAWAIVMLTFHVVSFLALRLLALRHVPEVRRQWSLVDFRLFRSVLRMSGSLILLRLSQMLSDTLNPIILTSFLGPAAVTLYRPGASLVRLASPFVQTLREQLHPITTAAHVAGEKARMQRLLIVGTRYTILLAIPVYVVLFIFAHPIIDAWVGRALGPEAAVTANVLMGLAAVEMVVCLGGSQFPVLVGANAVGFVAKIQLFFGVLNLIISSLLVGFTSLGVFGVVVATIGLTIVRRPILTVYTARVVGLPVREYWRAAYARPLFVMAVVVAFAWGLRVSLQVDHVGMLLLAAAATCSCWAALAWLLGLEASDRDILRKLVFGMWDRFRGPSDRAAAKETTA